jgi:hypothetical protein
VHADGGERSGDCDLPDAELTVRGSWEQADRIKIRTLAAKNAAKVGHPLSLHFTKERYNMSAINPEAAQPTTTQGFEQSDRNPAVTKWGGRSAAGGMIPAPASSASRVTQPGAAPPADAGLVNYDSKNSPDGVQDEAEREG